MGTFLPFQPLNCCFSDTSSLWMLGEKFSLQKDKDSDIVREKIQSLIWMSYRMGFETLGGYTSDFGWGCMYRCSQMMLGNVLSRVLAKNNPDSSKIFSSVVSLFIDNREAPYSIHSLVSQAETEFGKAPGEWVAPTEVLHVLSSVLKTKKSDHPPIFFYIVRDGILYLDDFCMERQRYGYETFCPSIISVPVRLGLDKINEDYVKSIQGNLYYNYFIGSLQIYLKKILSFFQTPSPNRGSWRERSIRFFICCMPK